MLEEEKMAIEKIERKITIGKCEKNIGIPVYISDLETILNLIEKQDKIIDLMGDYIAEKSNFCANKNCMNEDCHDNECIKEYFRNEVLKNDNTNNKKSN